jgi:hypothetical protein
MMFIFNSLATIFPTKPNFFSYFLIISFPITSSFFRFRFQPNSIRFSVNISYNLNWKIICYARREESKREWIKFVEIYIIFHRSTKLKQMLSSSSGNTQWGVVEWKWIHMWWSEWIEALSVGSSEVVKWWKSRQQSNIKWHIMQSKQISYSLLYLMMMSQFVLILPWLYYWCHIVWCWWWWYSTHLNIKHFHSRVLFYSFYSAFTRRFMMILLYDV